MKRIQLIAAALCLVMLTTVGASVVAAKQTENPRQAGASPIYFYDVQATDTHGQGKLMIDVKQGTFVFNGKEFTPDQTYTLIDRTTGSGIHALGTGKSTAAGNLHLAGTWEKGAALPGALGFVGASTGEVGTLYYIPPSGTQGARYLFDSDSFPGTYFFVTFSGTQPAPTLFSSSGGVSATIYVSTTDYAVIGGQRFDVRLSVIQQELVRHIATAVKPGTNEYTYIVDTGFYSGRATNVYLYGLPPGAFTPGTTTEIRAAIIDTSVYYIYPSGARDLQVNVLLLHPVSHLAHTIEPGLSIVVG